jgi:hypothetical protein
LENESGLASLRLDHLAFLTDLRKTEAPGQEAAALEQRIDYVCNRFAMLNLKSLLK